MFKESRMWVMILSCTVAYFVKLIDNTAIDLQYAYSAVLKVKER